MRQFVEDLWYAPKWYHWIVAVFLSPFALFWASGMAVRRWSIEPKDFSIPIVSIGNLQVGGTGKTPFCIALASYFDGVFVVSRGYGRQSKGLVEVSRNGEILCDVAMSGDEAFLIASMLPQGSVIVSEDRVAGIHRAKENGAKMIFLDDGFNQVGIKKYEILLMPYATPNILPMPSGPYREWWWYKNRGDIIATEGIDFAREVVLEGLTPRMILVTAIANPSRLDRYLPQGVVAKYYLPDHAYFDEDALLALLDKYDATSLLVTQKDSVKMGLFKLPISLIKLKLNLKEELIAQVKNYIKGYRDETQY